MIKYVRNMACISPYNDALKQRLTFTVKGYMGTTDGVVQAFREARDGLLIPRHFVARPVDNANWTRVSIPFKATLYDYQRQLCNKWLQVGHGIISASTGSGKTVLALYIAHKLGLKTLVVVSSKQLLDQWCERIETFCGFTPSIIQATRCDYSQPITVGMIHTLAFGKNVPRGRLLTTFGLTVYDEVHHLGAPVFNKAVQIFWDKHRLGLSATPKRSDGLTQLITYHIGNVVAVYKHLLVKPVVYLIRYYDRECTLDGCMTYEGEINMPRYLNKIAVSPMRNRLIVLLVETLAKKNRRILVLTDRKKQIRLLKALLCERGFGDRLAIMTGDVRQAPEQIILATYGVCGEGFDMPELDSLIFATPRFKIKQALGRLLRPKHIKPVVVDIVDNSLSRLYDAHKSYYDREDIQYKMLTMHRGEVELKWRGLESIGKGRSTGTPGGAGFGTP